MTFINQTELNQTKPSKKFILIHNIVHDTKHAKTYMHEHA